MKELAEYMLTGVVVALFGMGILYVFELMWWAAYGRKNGK